MKRFRILQQSGRGVFGTLIIASMLYAVFALATTPARAQSCELVSCTIDDASCYTESGGVGLCCYVCYNYSCPNGTTYSQCRTECGAQC
jgi:hypothetical protein